MPELAEKEPIVFEYEQMRPYLEIPGSIDFDDGTVLFDMAWKGPGENEPIIDVGAGSGRAAAFMARACAIEGRGSVIAADNFSHQSTGLFNGKELPAHQMLHTNLYKHRISPWVIIL